jgi:hypothetical protein
MQKCTAFRLAMLRNGYQPVLNDCKRPIEKGWPKRIVDEAEVLAWDRSAFASTGMKIDDDLAVVDADIREPALIDALAVALDKRYPELFARGLVRHAGEVKEAWFVRTDTPFQRIYSRKWCRGDPKDPTAITHRVECFGSRKTRQFGVDGPHARSKTGEVIDSYQFAGGASPANTPRELLPVLPKAAFAAACDLFNEIAAAAGLTIVKGEHGNGATSVVYDLTDNMVFESDSDIYRLGELEDALCAAQHEGRELRVTSSFLGHGTNATKCIIGYARQKRCIFIHDFETGLTHMPASRAPRARFEFLRRLQEENPFNAALPKGGNNDHV